MNWTSFDKPMQDVSSQLATNLLLPKPRITLSRSRLLLLLAMILLAGFLGGCAKRPVPVPQTVERVIFMPNQVRMPQSILPKSTHQKQPKTSEKPVGKE